MLKYVLISLAILAFGIKGFSQADNEIQVYASSTVGAKRTILELHSNYTFNGSTLLVDPNSANWANFTVESTTGIGDNFEIGFYLFTAVSPDGNYQYLGNQIRPRITAPESWAAPVGLSLSAEFGFFRPDNTSPFLWQGELRPIIDKTISNTYLSLNPNLEISFEKDNQSIGIAPQFKAMQSIKNKFGLGFEYYGFLGTFSNILESQNQEHLIGPIFDLLVDPDWELNIGVLFGLTENSNQQVLKVLVGRRFGS